MERNPKRQRLSLSPILDEGDEVDANHRYDEPDDVQRSSPPVAARHRRQPSPAAPRFRASTQSLPQQHDVTFIKPPRFRPPDPSVREQQSDPLPDQFSPHRRGQKYVPGGLAAEVRNWLVNLESSIPSSSTMRSGNSWRMKLMIDEVSGGGRAGFTLVKGRQVLPDHVDAMIDSLGTVNVVLAGEGTITGLQERSNVEVGRAVGIKSPVWEVVIEGETWGVGVDWTVLSDLSN